MTKIKNQKKNVQPKGTVMIFICLYILYLSMDFPGKEIWGFNNKYTDDLRKRQNTCTLTK